MKITKRHFLRKQEVKNLEQRFLERLKVSLPDTIGKISQVEIVVTGDGVSLFIVNEKPIAFQHDGKLVPTLVFTEVLSRLPKVVVDMGAIPHICNGADIMIPGIVDVKGDFKVDEVVLVVDEKYGKPIAIGAALLSSKDVEKLNRGKAVENLHYVGDKIWELIKTFSKKF
jgi:PUA domain protein